MLIKQNLTLSKLREMEIKVDNFFLIKVELKILPNILTVFWVCHKIKLEINFFDYFYLKFWDIYLTSSFIQCILKHFCS